MGRWHQPANARVATAAAGERTPNDGNIFFELEQGDYMLCGTYDYADDRSGNVPGERDYYQIYNDADPVDGATRVTITKNQ